MAEIEELLKENREQISKDVIEIMLEFERKRLEVSERETEKKQLNFDLTEFKEGFKKIEKEHEESLKNSREVYKIKIEEVTHLLEKSRKVHKMRKFSTSIIFISALCNLFILYLIFQKIQ